MHLIQGMYSLLGVLAINLIITNPCVIAVKHNFTRMHETSETGEIGAKYFNICVDVSPPFVVHANKGADIKLIKVIITQLVNRADADPQSIRVRMVTADVLAEINHCDIMFPNVWDNSTETLVAAQLIGSDFYHVDSMLLCAAKQRNKDDWRKLRTITTTQMTMVVPFVLYVAITYYIGGKMIHADKFQNLDVILWSYFRVLCSVPNSEQDQPKQRPLRFLYTGWLIFCFILTINYNTLILRVFKTELYTAHIVSIEQALEDHVDMFTMTAFQKKMSYPRVFDCGGVLECLSLLKATEQTEQKTSSYKKKINRNNKTKERLKKRVIDNVNEKLMIAIPATFMDYYRSDFLVSGESTINCFEHDHLVYKRQIFVRKQYRGSNPKIAKMWSIPTLNKLLVHINRSGIYKYWLQKLTKTNLQIQRSFHESTSFKSSNKKPNNVTTKKSFTGFFKSLLSSSFSNNPNAESDNKPHSNTIGVLVYKDFLVLYAYLLIGVLISTTGFAIEHFYYYYKHKKFYSITQTFSVNNP